jgi:hypothetical protein
VARPFALDSEAFGILGAQGEPIDLRVTAIGVNGDSSRLSQQAYQDHEYCLGLDATERSAAPFASVRVMSSAFVRLDSVQWQSTDK